MPSSSRDLERYHPYVKIRNLEEDGSALEINESVPLRRYFRSGDAILRVADAYHKQGYLESAFILYTKYITLFVEKIFKHPEMSSCSFPELNITNKKVKEIFPIAEKLKSKLLEKYTKEYEILLKSKERQEAEEAEREERRRLQEQFERFMDDQLERLMDDQLERFMDDQLERLMYDQQNCINSRICSRSSRSGPSGAGSEPGLERPSTP